MTNEKKKKLTFNIFLWFLYTPKYEVFLKKYMFIEIILLYCNEINFFSNFEIKFIFFEYTGFRRV
jgi:hypothetical protein